MSETCHLRDNKGKQCYEFVGEESDGSDKIIKYLSYAGLDAIDKQIIQARMSAYSGGFFDALDMLDSKEISYMG